MVNLLLRWIDRALNYFGYYADTVYADKSGTVVARQMGVGVCGVGLVRFRRFTLGAPETFESKIIDAVGVRADGSARDVTEVVRSFAGPRSDFFGAPPTARWFSHVVGEPLAQLQITYRSSPRVPRTYMPYDTIKPA